MNDRTATVIRCAVRAHSRHPSGRLKPEPARVAEVVHCCPKEHHELVHRCEVLRKLHATRLHSSSTLAAGGGRGHNEAERRAAAGGGGRGGTGVRCTPKGSSAQLA